MKVFVAGVGSESQYMRGVMTFHGIRLQRGDKAAVHYGATGLAGRKSLCDEFLREKEYDALLMVDLDMAFSEDTLDRLRKHDLDMVTGHYYRRQLEPMMSVIEVSLNGEWPYIPIVEPPTSGVHEIACAGMGCVLIKRHVIEAVADALPPFSHPFDGGPLPWLTGSDLSLGQDKRFFSLAQNLGYKLHLDADVRCSHAVTAWIDDAFYETHRNRRSQSMVISGYWIDQLGSNGVDAKSIKLRLQALELEREGLLAKFSKARDTEEEAALQQMSVDLRDYDSRMAECLLWLRGLSETAKFPVAPKGKEEVFVEKRTGTPAGIDPENIKKQREGVHVSEAMQFVELLNDRGRPGNLGDQIRMAGAGVPSGGDAGEGGPEGEEPVGSEPDERQPESG